MNHIDIERAIPGDHSLLFRLLQLYYFDSTRWSGEDILPDGLYESSEEGVRSYLAGGADRAYIARVNGHPAGFALVEPAEGFDEGVSELADMFVLPKYRGLGIGTSLIEHTIFANRSPWLVAMFRQDLAAQRYWRGAFERLPFRSVRALEADAGSRFLQYLVNE